MDLLRIYKKILIIRAVENKLDELFKRGLVHGTAHFCIGQEFIPVIISEYLTKEDSVTSTHRGHGHALAKNLDIKKFIAELLGKSIGFNKGKGGSQHVSSKEDNFFANGITGGMAPVAVGIAFANKYKNSMNITVNNNIAVAYLGDGSMTEGYVLESLNMAIVLKLPILFVCENNFYAMSTHVNKTHSTEIYKKAEAFGMKAALVDDNDYQKLNTIAEEFITNTRKNIPHFIEVRTYRHKGHSKNDLNLYRDKQEEKYWFDRDAVLLIEKELKNNNNNNYTEEQLKQIKEEIETEINKITEEVVNFQDTERTDLFEHVYHE